MISISNRLLDILINNVRRLCLTLQSDQYTNKTNTILEKIEVELLLKEIAEQ